MTPTSTQGTQHPENRQQNRFFERRFSEKTVTTGGMGKRGLLLSANNAQFVTSVD